MTMPSLEGFLFAGFVACFAFANMIAYLISAFYRRKFGQPSPLAGFIIAGALCAGYVLSVPFASMIMLRLQSTLLFGGSLASAWSAGALFYTMKKVRK